MKKSNKITIGYVICSLVLCLVLLGGGAYGLYLSIGMNFMRGTVANVTDVADNTVQNVSIAENYAMQPSLTGVIILSAILIVISIFDMISLIRQLVFFKQFKLIRESGLEHFIEERVKSKSSVVFFACLINILSFLAGVAGIFVNITSFANIGFAWVLYVVDVLVAVLAVVSIVLLIKKVKMDKPKRKELCHDDERLSKDVLEKRLNGKSFLDFKSIRLKNRLNNNFIGSEDLAEEVDSYEYVLLKLKSMKESNVISNEEYETLRERLTGLPKKSIKRKKVKSKTKM